MGRLAHRFVTLNLWLLLLTPTSLTAIAGQKTAKADAPPANLEQSSLPAAGVQKTLLNVTQFGRYSILAESKQGTALQLVDRMAGPSAIEGKAGEQDGRLDAFLERGQYQVIARGHKLASGTVRIDLRPFVERNLPQPPRLIETKLVEGQLHDFEQLSYWLDIEQRQTVILEAAGRSLADLRLWKDGNWLMDIHPTTQIITPKEGQPLFSCRISTDLDPGLYLLTAYGGSPQIWSEDNPSHPFYIRRGIPQLGAAGRRRFVISPFGIDRYLVPGSATYFRIEIPEARTTSLQVDWFKTSQPFEISGPRSEISKKSIPPVAELHVPGGNSRTHIVEITGEAGQPYVFQQFEVKYIYPFEGNKEYWISTIHSGFAADSIDATAIITQRPRYSGRSEFLRAQTVELGSKEYWHRRVNLLDTTTLFLHIKNTGVYQLSCQGVEAKYKIEPFLTDHLPDYRSPEPRACGSTWDLDAGYYELTILPTVKGIADLLMRPAGLLDSLLANIGLDKEVPITPSRGATRFDRVALSTSQTYTLYINRQPGVQAGMILRSLPVDLNDPLYIVQESGETVSVPFQVKEAGTLRAEAEDGSLLELSVDGGLWQTSIPVGTTAHTVSIRHSRGAAVSYSLAVVPKRLEAQTPLPALSPEALEALPKFPVIDETASRVDDLKREQSATYLLKADKAALYQLQTTGLLATSGNLRSRTNPSYVRKSQNGVGRNFSLQQYLREGDYQVTVKTEGRSAGHYGLELNRTKIRNGGFLTSRIPARATLEPGQAIAYYFIITNPGEFRLRAFGEGRTFRCRLEDKDGWPVLQPDIEADITRYFSPGQYRLVLLPETTAARVVAQIEPTPRQRRYQGHGPHTLSLASTINHIWLEPEDDNPRTPDQWEFAAPAPIEVTIHLSNEMQGNLLRLDDSGNAIQTAKVMPGRNLVTELEMGRYRLEVVASRRNNQAPYQVTVMPTELVTGLSRKVTAPVSIPLSVGKPGLVEINSFGKDDVQARLYDNQGRLIAFNDDRPDDWNFLISCSLAPGSYRLQVNPAGKADASTIVSLLTPEEESQKALSLPAQLKPVLRRAVQLYPLPPVSKPALLVAAVDSNENVGLAVEALQGDVWQILASSSDKSPEIQIPLGSTDASRNTEHRLRVWALDRREMRIGLSVESILPQTATEAQLQAGIPVTPSKKSKSSTTAFIIRLNHPGIFEVDENSPSLCWSADFREPCRPSETNLVAAWKNNLWAATRTPDESTAKQTIRAHRLVLSSGTQNPLQLPTRNQGNVYFDLAPNDGNPILVLATSQEGQPAIQLKERDQSPPSTLTNVAIAPRVSASALLGARAPNAAVWAATPENTAHDVRLRPLYFPSVQELPPTDIGDGKLEGIRATAFTLKAGLKKFHLTLGTATVAVLSKGNEIVSVHWQGGAPFNTTVESSADRLMLLHTRKEEDRYAVEVIPLREEELLATLSMGVPYEQNHLRSGIERLTVRVPPESTHAPFTLHTRGAVESVTYISDSGQVLRGNDFKAPIGAGTLEISHGAGLLLCWIDRLGNEAEGLLPSIPDPARATIISPPEIYQLHAATEVFSIKTPEPVLLHVRMPSSSISMIRRASGESEVNVHPNQTLMEAYLPEGTTSLYLRTAGGGSLSGSVEFTSSPVTPVSEGLGPEVLLAPGDCRLFSFEVRQAGPVGVGVRASSDVVETELLSSNGKSLGKGTVQKFNLNPGLYLLALRAPAQGVPVRAQPAVVGIVLPSTGPPEDVIRKYLALDEQQIPFTSRGEASDFQPSEYIDESGPEGTIADPGYMEEPNDDL
jgi:hypothetical protein